MKGNLGIFAIVMALGLGAIYVAKQDTAHLGGAEPFEATADNTPRFRDIRVGPDGSTSNEVTRLLVNTVTARRDLARQRLILAKRSDRLELLSRAHWATVFTIMSDDQRNKALQTWRESFPVTSKGWPTIVDAPYLAKELHHVSKLVNLNVAGILASVDSRRSISTQGLLRRIRATNTYKCAKTDRERAGIMDRMIRGQSPAFPLVDRAIEVEGLYREASSRTRTLLTAGQRAEFDAILKRSEENILRATTGIA